MQFDMEEGLLWVWSLTDILPQSHYFCIQYCVIFYNIITAPDCKTIIPQYDCQANIICCQNSLLILFVDWVM